MNKLPHLHYDILSVVLRRGQFLRVLEFEAKEHHARAHTQQKRNRIEEEGLRVPGGLDSEREREAHPRVCALVTDKHVRPRSSGLRDVRRAIVCYLKNPASSPRRAFVGVSE